METINETQRFERHRKIENSDTSISDLCNGVSLLVCICLILYFCLMSLGKLHEVILFRFLNFIILSGGILFALNLYSKTIKDKIPYSLGMLIGIRITFISVIPFVLFMAFFLYFDNHFMEVVKQSVSIGEYLNPITAAGAVCIEGISSGVIITFMAMQYFKKQ